MTLYSHNGQYPAPLPFRITLPDGRTRTDPATFVPQEIIGAGFVEVPDPPTYDPATQTLEWGGGMWVIEALPVPTPTDFTLTRRQVRAALVLNGFAVDAIPTAIQSISDPTEQALALIDWEDAPYYARSHPLFSDPHLMSALGVTSEQIDTMWMQAKDLPA